MVKAVPPSMLSEGDNLLDEIKIGNRTIKPSVHGLSKEEIILIRKAKKRVKIKIGVPLVPVILASFLLSCFFSPFPTF